jgi:hypothetical protein
MMSGLSCTTLMRALLRLSLHIRIIIIGNTKLSQKPDESRDGYFARFESIVSNLRSCGPLAYSDNERAKQLLYALDDHIWGMKITDLEESVDFATLDTQKIFSKLKSHELFRKGRLNHDTSLTSKALITGAHVGGHDANPTNMTVSSAFEFALSSLVVASDEQYESIQTTRSPCWRESFVPCTSSVRRGGHLLGAASGAATPLTSSPSAPRGRSLTPPIITTTPRKATTARATTRRATASGTRISFRR